MTSLSWLLLPLGCLVWTAGAVAQAPAAATLVRRARELNRDIVTRTAGSSLSVDYGVAEGVVTAPVDAVMSAITDYGSYAQFVPNFQQSRVLSQRGQNALVYFQAGALENTLTFWAQTRVYARPSEGETRVIEGRMREGNLSHFVARWEITPIDERRTLVEFRVLFVPDMPFPSALVTAENVRAARKTVRNLRARLEGV